MLDLFQKVFFYVSHQTAGADDDRVVGVDVGVVLGDLGVVGLVLVVGLVGVTIRQLWGGGGLAQPGPVAAVVVTSHRATVALFRPSQGPQGRDVLVVVRTGQAVNRFLCEKIFQLIFLLGPTESQEEEEGLQSSHRSDRTELSLGRMTHSRRHCPPHQPWPVTPSHCPQPQSSPGSRHRSCRHCDVSLESFLSALQWEHQSSSVPLPD